SSVDRHVHDFYNFARKYNFTTFLIAMDIPADVHRQWIVAGGDRPFNSAATYLELMPQRRDEQAAFLSTHQSDLTVQPGYAMADIIAQIRIKLANLGQ